MQSKRSKHKSEQMEKSTQAPSQASSFLNDSAMDSTQAGPSFSPPPFQLQASGSGIVQRYTKTRANDGGNHIGEPSACHCHIDIGKPHFKVGNDKGSRINFGNDMSLKRMQIAYNTLLSQHSGKAGYDDCKEYLEEMGCVEQEAEDKVQMLKDLLLMWGGLSDTEISYYDEDANWVSVPVYSKERLNDTIEEHEDEIMKSSEGYNDFLDDGDFFSTEENKNIDWDEIHDEEEEIYGAENRKAKRNR